MYFVHTHRDTDTHTLSLSLSQKKNKSMRKSDDDAHASNQRENEIKDVVVKRMHVLNMRLRDVSERIAKQKRCNQRD